MSDLSRFRDHARAMATAQHRVDCPSLRVTRWQHDENGLRRLTPACDGCVPDGERALWKQLADEIDNYTPETL